jgi:hypothetical protein
MEYKVLEWGGTLGSHCVNVHDHLQARQWHQCKNIVSQSRHLCRVGSWVFATSPFEASSLPITGRISEILKEVNGDLVVAVLDVFEIRSERHPVFNMPVLARQFNEQKLVLVSGKVSL